MPWFRKGISSFVWWGVPLVFSLVPLLLIILLEQRVSSVILEGYARRHSSIPELIVPKLRELSEFELEAVSRILLQTMARESGIEPYLVDRHGVIQGHAVQPLLPFVNLRNLPELTVEGDRPVYLGSDPSAAARSAPVSIEYLGPSGAALYTVLVSEKLQEEVEGQVRWACIFVLVVTLPLIPGVVGLYLLVVRRRFVTPLEEIVGKLSSLFPVATLPSKRGGDPYETLVSSLRAVSESVRMHMRFVRERGDRQSESIAAVSHDLKGTLSAIRAFSDTVLAKGPSLSSEQVARYLGEISAKAMELGESLERIFECLGLETIEEHVKVASLSPRQFIEDAAERFMPMALEKRITIETESTLNMLKVIGDPELLARAYSNLVENSLKYTDGGGTIVVSAHFRAGRVWLGVRDTGVGIQPGELPHVFTKFYRGSHSSAHGGWGIGLFTVKRIVEAHGAELRIESEPGKGTFVEIGLHPSTQA